MIITCVGPSSETLRTLGHVFALKKAESHLKGSSLFHAQSLRGLVCCWFLRMWLALVSFGRKQAEVTPSVPHSVWEWFLVALKRKVIFTVSISMHPRSLGTCWRDWAVGKDVLWCAKQTDARRSVAHSFLWSRPEVLTLWIVSPFVDHRSDILHIGYLYYDWFIAVTKLQLWVTIK